MKLEHSETLQCLVNAFAGESQARNRYTFFAKVAKQEGYEQISQIFLDTAENEKEHAKLFYKHIPNAEHLTVTGAYPFFYGDTYENLKAASSGEREEWEILYRNSAQVAKEDGFDGIAFIYTDRFDFACRKCRSLVQHFICNRWGTCQYDNLLSSI